jgi:hypothetical protein
MNLVSTRHDYYIDLLAELTENPRCKRTNLVICQPRTEFLHHLVLQAQHQSELATSVTTEPHPDNEHQRSHAHSLMTPSLRLIAASRAINLIFCPSIPTLRAWLSTYGTDSISGDSDNAQLIIVDLLALHHGTSEFTLQGISKTLANAASAAHSTGSPLMLAECKDINDPSNPDRGSRLWDQHLPLLTGSVKIGLERSRWAGQSVTVKSIASRWFSFGASQIRRSGIQEEEMLI